MFNPIMTGKCGTKASYRCLDSAGAPEGPAALKERTLLWTWRGGRQQGLI